MLLCDIESGKAVRLLEGQVDRVLGIAFSPDDQKLLAGEVSLVRLWDVRTEQLFRIVEGYLSGSALVAFPTNGGRVLTAGANWDEGTGDWASLARLSDVQNGLLLRTFMGHGRAIHSIAFSPDGQRVLTGSWDKTARAWDAQTGALLVIFAGHTQWIWPAVFSADGYQVLTASGDGAARL